MRTNPASARCESGFSMVELMVSLVAGLVVSGAVLTFTVATVRSSAEYVGATRLSQELRSTLDYASRELRRAGYDQDYLARIAEPTTSTDESDFAPILLSGSCIIYAYDRQPGTPGDVDPDNGEVRGIRLIETADGVGVIEAATSDATNTPACDDDASDYSTYPATCEGAWCPLSDYRTVDITTFSITDSSAVVGAASTSAIPLRIREFAISVQGNLIDDADVVRGAQTRVRVRADCLRTSLTSTNVSDCVAVPSSL